MKQTSSPHQILKIGARQIALLEKLSNACAVSGDEEAVRAIVRDRVKAVADEIKVDAMGNLLVTRHAHAEGALRVMLAAHMDEVGFMIVNDDKDGIYRFEMVGGIDVRQIVGKPVKVGKKQIPGVIGACPIHLTTPDERDRKIGIESLRIDVGPGGDKAKIGERAAFATRFERIGACVRGKALDNRLGVATLIELVNNAPPDIELLAAFTVQEEIGLRGARVAAYAFDPQVAIAIDSTPAYDLPTWDDEENPYYNTRLGSGPAIYIADGSTLSHPALVRHLTSVADEYHIPYQLRQPGGGGTDAGAIHRQRSGIPSISVSVPARYAHTAIQIAQLADWQNTLRLLHAALQHISPADLQQD